MHTQSADDWNRRWQAVEAELDQLEKRDTPAQKAAQRGVKVADVIKTKRDFESWLHDDLGFSRSESRRMTAQGWEHVEADMAMNPSVRALMDALRN